ncbi:MAG: hypothetical protein ACR2HR_16960 [Euzebya sp.]
MEAISGPIITAEDVSSARVRREVDGHLKARVADLNCSWRSSRPQPALPHASEMRTTSPTDIGSTLQGLVAKRLIRLEPGGYRVVSRALARELAGR